ncbi:MAG: tRNA preQ1(34) S-adenosylmethionine ribosyltransferase-isomerase QueA [Treponema sp.]|nr:tRNA preQ1(34) S-adenosylmethionine ribosyltransferase-isomerase QueA [Treponema sp.]
MKTADFWFDLPKELIAQYPPPERGKSRLMTVDLEKGFREHRMVCELPVILAERLSSGPGALGPLLVFNNSRVRKARLPGRSLSAPGSAAADFLLVNRLDSVTWRVLVEKSKRKKPGSHWEFSGGVSAEIVEAPGESAAVENAAGIREDGFRYLRFDSPVDDDWLDIHGHIPLPPYIARPDTVSDSERYQTVYADRKAAAGLGPGASAAAPTAGLHFTGEMFAALEGAGIEAAFVTLHVGLGTFLPVRCENVEDHVMHEEVYSIDDEAARRINSARAEGRKIVAVGTTSLRTLESAWNGERIKAGGGTTSIFIYPGYRFRSVDGLFTNFHTPGSTLLMLVSAFAENRRACTDGGRPAGHGGAALSGLGLVLESYAAAIRAAYRFFSYGDAMLMY